MRKSAGRHFTQLERSASRRRYSLVVLLLAVMFLSADIPSAAQDATPAANCLVTTTDENEATARL